ncbi:hypothetical protein BKP37_14865 [Anaerobacillus alkalilacustris]|uniref:M23ase beta-sheet core domain-containing protein n=1 Tax=Anaerobacillus alkalilacustris TaxID=393763 RepID=A0A1S2LI13_9BACI|nr:M23 family metallopeptidase [Anaerobacillus alkalilacustris]OIJ11723.1 hypothetical protein BKP37_14865 [Anaerobacillus alkalilacustris]
MREENQSSKLTKMKANLQKMMKKRWALPAVYLGLGAVVLSGVLYLQGTANVTQEQPVVDDEGYETGADIDVNYEDAFPVAKVDEVIKMPVVNEDEVKVIGYFFDFDATEEEQKKALVLYDNTYRQNKGIDLAMESGETFDVTAALSGTVVKAEEDALFGKVVHIEHDNGVVTVYQSLDDLKVEAGQSVKQGDIIAQAGRSLYNKDAGVHVHFEIRQDGTPVNPMDFFNQTVSAVDVSDNANDPNEDEEETEEADEKDMEEQTFELELEQS